MWERFLGYIRDGIERGRGVEWLVVVVDHTISVLASEGRRGNKRNGMHKGRTEETPPQMRVVKWEKETGGRCQKSKIPATTVEEGKCCTSKLGNISKLYGMDRSKQGRGKETGRGATWKQRREDGQMCEPGNV